MSHNDSFPESDDSSEPVNKAFAAGDAVPQRLTVKQKKRVGKQSFARKQENYRAKRNERAIEERLQRMSNPYVDCSSTKDITSLLAKFQRWDQVLANGGVIFETNEMSAPLMIETEPVIDVRVEETSQLFCSRTQLLTDQILEYTGITQYPEDLEAEDLIFPAEGEEAEEMEVEDVQEEEAPSPNVDVDLASPASQKICDIGATFSHQSTSLRFDHTDFVLKKATVAARTGPLTRAAPKKKLRRGITNVLVRGGCYHLSSETRPERPPGPTCLPRNPCQDQAAGGDSLPICEEPLISVEVYKRVGEAVAMVVYDDVRRVTMGDKLAPSLQFHPLTRKELFGDWIERICIYPYVRYDGHQDYVRVVLG